MTRTIINGEGAIMGRLASDVAKRALQGEEVIILNSEKVIISGTKNRIIEKYKELKALGGTAQKGPYYSRNSFMLLKRAIRGMLPSHREGVGREAFKRIKCYEGVPEEFKNEKMLKIKTSIPEKHIELGELSKNL